MEHLKKLIKFLDTDIWRIRTRTLKGHHSFWIMQLRTLLLAVRGFDENKCQLRASALTFYSLLSIVPILAMAFGIAKGFGFQSRLEAELLEKMHGQEEVVSYVISFAQSLLENTQGGIIAGFGVAFLFWTVIKVLSNIEASFNEIWGVQKGRSWARKFGDYLAIMLIAPILLIMSSSLTLMIITQLTLMVDKLSFLGPIGNVILFFAAILLFGVMWILFVFIYMLMPNTKVHFGSALFGGILAGTIYQIVQWVYISFQMQVSNFGAVYGSFAALPLFLLWLQMSWLIVLFGAELCFAHQNVHTYEFEPDCPKVSPRFKKLIALGIAQYCVKQFDDGKPPPDVEEIAAKLEAPIRLINLALFELSESGVLSEVKQDNGRRTGYQPSRDIDDISLVSVLEKLERKGFEEMPFVESAEIKKIERSLEHLLQTAYKSPDNIKLKDINGEVKK